MPIRNEMHVTIFNGSLKVYNSRLLETEIFQAHTKGMLKGQLPRPLARFVARAEYNLTELGERIDKHGGSLDIELVCTVNDVVFEGATDALFGAELCSFPGSKLDRDQLRQVFIDLDTALPLLVGGLAAGLLPQRLISLWPKLAKGVAARSTLTAHFKSWVQAGTPGLDEEGSVRNLVESGERVEIGDEELAKVLLSAFW